MHLHQMLHCRIANVRRIQAAVGAALVWEEIILAAQAVKVAAASGFRVATDFARRALTRAAIGN